MFRVTRPYQNIQVKPRFFFRFSGNNIILCILKGEMPFKMHKIIFSRIYVRLPYLKFSDPYQKHTYFFYLA